MFFKKKAVPDDGRHPNQPRRENRPLSDKKFRFMMVAQAQLIGRGQLSSGAIDALASIPDELIFDDEAMYWQVTPAITAYFGGSGTINTSIEKHIKKWKLNHD